MSYGDMDHTLRIRGSRHRAAKARRSAETFHCRRRGPAPRRLIPRGLGACPDLNLRAQGAMHRAFLGYGKQRPALLVGEPTDQSNLDFDVIDQAGLARAVEAVLGVHLGV